MKKLIIAAAIVCAAAMSQAAQYNWFDGNDDLMISGQDVDPVAGGLSVYLFATTTGTAAQQAVLDAFIGGGMASGYLSTSTTTASGSVTVKDYDDAKVSGVDPDWTGFFALINEDKGELFISDVATFTVQASSRQPVAFGDQFDFAIAEARDAAGGFQGAGWYAAAVPEPTSGLLLLLGVAGLALKRRRA